MVRTEHDYAIFPRHFKKVHTKMFFDLTDKNYKKAKMKLDWMKTYGE